MLCVASGKGGSAYTRETNEKRDNFKPQVLLVWGADRDCESAIHTL